MSVIVDDYSLVNAIDSAILEIKQNQKKECPRCKLIVKGPYNIEKYFGLKKLHGERIPKNYCKKCTSKKFTEHQRFVFENLSIHTIEQAKDMKNNFNVEGIVTEKDFIKNIPTGNRHTIKICSALLTDQFNNSVKIYLWGNNTSIVKNNSKIRIVNGYTRNYNNEIVLSVMQNGRIEIVREYERKHSFHKMHFNEPSQLSDDSWIISSDDMSNSYLKNFID